MGWLLDYFDLSSGVGVSATPQPIPLGWQLGFYAAVLLGILASSYLAAARTRRRYRFRWQRILISAIIGLAIFPAVYQGAQANLGQPGLVQLALVFSSGLGYESLFSGVVGLAGAPEK
jgi:hypothetical protein